jgi:tetratricopeptide (TPR) repeat protein
MPDPREIDRLKKIVRSLGHELEVLKERGEPYNDMPPPPEPGPLPEPTMRAESAGPASVNEEGMPDFASLLQDLDLSAPEVPPEESEPFPFDSSPAPAQEEPLADFDLGAFSGADLTEAEPSLEPEATRDLGGLADFGLGAMPEEPEAVPELAPEEPAEVPAQGDAADLSALTGDLGGDFNFSLPEGEPGIPSAAEPAVEEELPSFDEAESFGLESAAPVEEVTPVGGEEPTALDNFSIDELAESPAAPAEGPSTDFSINEFSIPGEESISLSDETLESPPPAAAAKSAPLPEAPSLDQAFSDFNFGEGADIGKGDSFDSELAALDEPLKAQDTFQLDSTWAQPSAKPSGGAFSSESFGSDFDLGELGGAPQAGAQAQRKGKGPAQPQEPLPTEVALTEKEVDQLQDALLSYPLNLRLEIEQILSDDYGDPALAVQVINLLVKQTAPLEMASKVGKLIGKRIKVPKDFEMKKGAEFEAERGTFWYAVKTNILPIASMALLILIGIGLLSLMFVKLVWEPLQADSLYRSGMTAIRDEDYPQSVTLFDKAYKVKASKEWHYRYASAYIEKRQYLLAEEKYKELLRRYRHEKRAALAYAQLESDILYDFEKAEEVLKKTLLNWDPQDRDGLLALGDNYLTWADESEGQDDRLGLLERARKTYANLIRLYGKKDAYMGRMLRYFVRVDDMKEVQPLRDYILSGKKTGIDALTHAELAAYLIDQDKLEGVKTILMTAVKKEPGLPEPNYQLARFFNKTNVPVEENKALSRAIRLYEALPYMTRERLKQYIDALHWTGNWNFKKRLYVPAEGFYGKAIKVYEDAIAQKRFAPSARFGEIYARLADVYYYDSAKFDTAFDLFQKAERNLYSTPDTNYKRGFVMYRKSSFKDALLFFYKSADKGQPAENLLYSTGNALFNREDYATAAAYYEELSNRLKDDIDHLAYLDPQERPDQNHLITMQMITANNLGVSQTRLAARMGNAAMRSKGMAHLVESARLYDFINRDQVTLIRPDETNLANLNLYQILHPEPKYVPLIYQDISKDLVDSPEKISIKVETKSDGS